MSHEHNAASPERRWSVLKFGGTSVSSAECWSTIVKQARHNTDEGQHVMIVVSALSGVTNLLTRLADCEALDERREIVTQLAGRHEELHRALNLEAGEAFRKNWTRLEALAAQPGPASDVFDRAELLAQGEMLSSAIGAQVLAESGLSVLLQDARDLLQVLPGDILQPLAARCGDHADPALEERLAEQGRLHITQGFQAAGPNGKICLLGRGGSDTSAAYLAARLGAGALEIWTDVPGIFSADPRVVPEARLLRQLSFSEAQELASMGARVLHPPSIQPARRHGIPVMIRDTNRPSETGTLIAPRSGELEPQVRGVVSRSGIALISMESAAMWHQAGFLADAFGAFKQHGFSVDLISTSESTVTVSLDPLEPSHDEVARMNALLEDLSSLCQVRLHTDRVSISLVGNAIRTILGRLAAALEVFQDRHVHMVTQSANDLNLTLVVDPEHAVSLVRKLHQLLIGSQAASRPEFGPSWAEMTRPEKLSERPDPWWKTHAQKLRLCMGDRDAAYVYHLDSARQAAGRLMALDSVDRVLYSVKANDHPDLLRALAGEGVGFECVSLAEVNHVRAQVPGGAASGILYTPNFASRREYLAVLETGVNVTIDNAWVLRQWPELFEGREIFLRLDLDSGYGHHKKVITSGADSKFGISLEHLEAVSQGLRDNRTRVVGLHAHTGSGVNNADVWGEQLRRLLGALPLFPHVRVLDLGGGLGVPERSGQAGLDLQELDEVLSQARGDFPVELWLEPGRYLAAECGVLLARVTQLKNKGQYRYLGVATGMNSLIRPALYGAFHEIFNLDRLQHPADINYRVVGPICESGDVLGEDRFLPRSSEGDIILIANAGAYGRVMSSHYNRRAPAEELVL
jgi:diaminopimelate decarboxylase/aspartate kinase